MIPFKGAVASVALAALVGCATPGEDCARPALPPAHSYGCGAEDVELAADGGLWSTSFPCPDEPDVERVAPFHGSCCEPAEPFDEVLPSWNVALPEGASFRVEVQVAREDEASPWLDIGGWGAWPADERAPTGFAGGRVEVDILRLDGGWTEAHFRLRTRGGRPGELARLARFAATMSRSWIYAAGESARSEVPGVERRNQPGFHAAAWAMSTGRPVPERWPPEPRALRLRHQQAEGPELGPRICSPTSVAMVLEAQGVDVPTREVAELVYDREHDIYGNWSRAVQGAFILGAPGRVTRLSSWNEAAHLTDHVGPLVISIAAEEGQLRGAPYPRTDGHLLVLAGFDLDGHAIVYDPATPVGDEAPRLYALEELEVCWLRRGGTAYVLGR